MTTESKTRLISAMTGIVLMAVAGSRNLPLREHRASFHELSEYALQDAPPLMSLVALAMGGSRGLIADMLWIRIAYLQQAGNNLETAQLSRWVTRLEPGNEEVWTYHAWNMSYNVSVLFPDEETRWHWIHNSILMLRDEGILVNPDAPSLYRYIGWIYQDKIGGGNDRYHLSYKLRLAAAAMERAPSLRNTEGRVGPLLEQERAALAEHFGMDPELMIQVEQFCGTQDWRMAQLHAIYWGERGRMNHTGMGLSDCDRLVYQNASILFHMGNMYVSADNTTIVQLPAPETFTKVVEIYRDVYERRNVRTTLIGFKHFLFTAAPILYMHGYTEEARTAYDMLVNEFEEIPASVPFEVAMQRLATTDPNQLQTGAYYAFLNAHLQYAHLLESQDNATLAEQHRGIARSFWDRAIEAYGENHKDWGIPPFEELVRRNREHFLSKHPTPPPL